jgi:hypothetical protein
MADDDIQRLMEMRRQASMLELHADPLLSGLIAQLVGIIDALIGIAQSPHSDATDALVQAKR